MIQIAKENIITEECSFDDNINTQVPHDISFVVTQPGEGGSSVTLGAHRFKLHNIQGGFLTPPKVFLKRLPRKKDEEKINMKRGELNISIILIVSFPFRLFLAAISPVFQQTFYGALGTFINVCKIFHLDGQSYNK